uniref:Nonstructural protein n=1 Tax=Army ant associated chapparvovirus 16 TaxID=3003979 RepID=A0A9Y1HU98_9VIRU|nr:MAG: nonstructural protein [Army ant associated chapparvovirus 16]WAX26062.1 MAG: nonstructural protein [Army ant associated chapparvovirus 16]
MAPPKKQRTDPQAPSGRRTDTASHNLRFHHRQYWAIRRRLEREGKWDNTRNPDNVPTRPGSPIYQAFDDFPLDIELELAGAADQAEGKSTLMYNVKSGDLSHKSTPMSLKCNEREIPETDQASSGDDLESNSQANGAVSGSYFSIFHERRNVFSEVKQVEGAHRGHEVSGNAEFGGGTSGVHNAPEYVRDNMLVIWEDGVYRWGSLKETLSIKPLNFLQDYFQSYNSVCIVIKCLPDHLADIDTSIIYDCLRAKIYDPFVLISERSSEGVLHWHMLWLTSKRTDNAKRLLQKYLEGINKNFSIACQQTKSFKHILRYILKEPITLSVAHSKHLQDYCFALCSEDVVYTPKAVESTDNKMITAILNVMKTKHAYTTEELMKVAPEVMIGFLHKSNLESIVHNCKTFLLKPSDTNMLLERLTFDCTADNFFCIYAYLMYQCVEPIEFLLDFFNIFCKFPDKRNVFVIQGASNTGKTTFLRPLLELLTFGEVVSGGQFMFQNCINKELLIWEEPLIGSDFVEMCKRVFEGMSTQVPVKFKAPQTLYRTPLFITTNKDLWYYSDGDEVALRNRIVLYKFNNDAAGFSKLSPSWWRQCFECYSKDCGELSLYVTGCDPSGPASPKSSRTTTSRRNSGGSEQFLGVCACGSELSEPVDIGAGQCVIR